MERCSCGPTRVYTCKKLSWKMGELITQGIDVKSDSYHTFLVYRKIMVYSFRVLAPLECRSCRLH